VPRYDFFLTKLFFGEEEKKTICKDKNLGITRKSFTFFRFFIYGPRFLSPKAFCYSLGVELSRNLID